MANHKSALKQYRRDQKRRQINRMNRSKMRNKVKKIKRALDAGETDTAKTLYPEVMSVIDRTIIKGTIHKKTGSRYKSRLMLQLAKNGVEL